MAKAAYKETKKGTALHAHCARPDTKYNADGLFHTDFIHLDDAEGEEFRKEIDQLAEEALEEHLKTITPAQRKKWSIHYPYRLEEDKDTGAETGRIIFRFKQNAVIHLKDGTQKPIEIGLFDAKRKKLKEGTSIFTGDTIKCLYKPRVVVMQSAQKVGIRLDFAAVQLIKKRDGAGSGGFSEEPEDGFEDDAEENTSQQSSQDGDY